MNSAIIVAAGRGRRMNADRKKQYLHLGENPIIIETLKVFAGCGLFENLYLVVPPADEAYCREMLGAWPEIHVKCRVVHGGESRQESVYRGLLAMSENPADLVAIHDGVRPLVTPEMIASCVRSARKTGACILAVAAQDTLKRVRSGGDRIEKTLARSDIWLAQTPQVFNYALIREAHERAAADGVSGTDDAMLVERMGHPVHVVPGAKTNLKITTPEDLAMAKALLSIK